jgi:hypothetical protein
MGRSCAPSGQESISRAGSTRWEWSRRPAAISAVAGRVLVLDGPRGGAKAGGELEAAPAPVRANQTSGVRSIFARHESAPRAATQPQTGVYPESEGAPQESRFHHLAATPVQEGRRRLPSCIRLAPHVPSVVFSLRPATVSRASEEASMP